MDLRYGDVEKALIRAFGVGEKGLSSFRARIRHLRKFNVAGLPQTGTGRQIVYEVDHARLMHTALRLNYMGIPPEPLGMMFCEFRPMFLFWFGYAAKRPEADVRAAVLIERWSVREVAEVAGDEAAAQLAAYTVREGAEEATWLLFGTVGVVGDENPKLNFEGAVDVLEGVGKMLGQPDLPYVVLPISRMERAIQKALAEVVAEREAAPPPLAEAG